MIPATTPNAMQVEAWLLHANGQMASARTNAARARRYSDLGMPKLALRSRRVAADCVASARASRRVAREMAKGGAR